jgi:hypothetical protein
LLTTKRQNYHELGAPCRLAVLDKQFQELQYLLPLFDQSAPNSAFRTKFLLIKINPAIFARATARAIL